MLNGGPGDITTSTPGVSTSPADNGGPTQTLALVPPSPALGGGGECQDPRFSGLSSLTTDQRGYPRPAMCDIGAFQFQPAEISGSPEIRGKPDSRGYVTCSVPTGVLSGDSPLSQSYSWQRNGAAISGATSSQYAPTSNDAGEQLACMVAVSNYAGDDQATSDPVEIDNAATSGGGSSGGGQSGAAQVAAAAKVRVLRVEPKRGHRQAQS